MAGTRTTQINIIIAGDASQVSAAFAKVSAEAQQLGGSLDQAGARAEAAGAEIAAGAERGVGPLALLGSAGEKVEASFARAAHTFALFGLAMYGIHEAVDLIKEMSASTIEAEKIQAQQAAVLASTGGAAGMTAQSLDDLAQSLKRQTTYDDDAVKSAENLLLTFTNIGSDIFPQATRAVLDMNTAMGQDLSNTAIQVGKALQDPVNGATTLRRVGVQLSDQQMQLIKTMVQTGDVAGAQQVILRELSKEFGGSAAAAVNTFGGQIQQLHNNLDDLTKTSAGGTLPAMTQLVALLNKGVTSNKTIEFFKNLSTELNIVAHGNLLADVGVQVEKVLYVVAFQWAQFLKNISLGKIDLSPQLAAWREGIVGFEQDLDPLLAQTGEKVGAALSGQDGGALSPSAVAADAQQVFSAYIAGFSQADLSQLSGLQGVIKDALSLSGNEDPGAALNLDPIVARAIDELRRFGAVSDETKARLKAMLGDAYPEVEQYIDGLAALNDAQIAARESAMALGVAQAQYAALQTLATNATKEAQAALDDATAAQKRHQQAAQGAEDAVRAQLDTVNREASASAAAYQAQLDSLNAGLKDLRDKAQADADAFAQLTARAQKTADDARAAAQQHAGMYDAILNNTVGYYDELIGKEDQLTQAIREKWAAEFEGLNREKAGSDQRLFNARAAQHKADLDFDTRIQQARESGNIAQANALQRQKDLKDKQAQNDMQVLQDQAQVNDDNLKAATDQLNKDKTATQQQDALNQQKADNDLKAIQDRATQQKDADDQAIANQQKQIDNVQARKDADQKAWDARKGQLNDELTQIQQNAQARDLMDQTAIDKAQKHKDIVAGEWDDTLAKGKQAVTNAKDEKTAADGHLATQGQINDTIAKRLGLYAQEFTAIQKNNDEAAKNPNLPQNQPPSPPGIQENQPAGGGGTPAGGGASPGGAGQNVGQSAPQLTAATTASAPPAVHFHFPNVTGAASPETARQAGLAGAQAFIGAFSDARKSGAGRVTA